MPITKISNAMKTVYARCIGRMKQRVGYKELMPGGPAELIPADMAARLAEQGEVEIVGEGPEIQSHFQMSPKQSPGTPVKDMLVEVETEVIPPEIPVPQVEELGDLVSDTARVLGTAVDEVEVVDARPVFNSTPTSQPTLDSAPRVFTCKHCGMGFAESLQLAKHVRFEHPKSPEEKKKVKMARTKRAAKKLAREAGK